MQRVENVQTNPWRQLLAVGIVLSGLLLCLSLDWYRQQLTTQTIPRVPDRSKTGFEIDGELGFIGTPQATPYVYEQTAVGYNLSVPPYWDLALARTPHNPYYAVVLRSPDYQDSPDEYVRRLESGSEFFIYAERPRRIAPSPRAEVNFNYTLGELGPLPLLRTITIDKQPGYSYYRFPGGKYVPFQTAIVSHQGLHYRIIYRTAIADLSHPLRDFQRHQAEYEALLRSIDLPL